MTEMVGIAEPNYGNDFCWKAVRWIDSDGDNIPNQCDSCPNAPNLGIDSDYDDTDDDEEEPPEEEDEYEYLWEKFLEWWQEQQQ